MSRISMGNTDTVGTFEQRGMDCDIIRFGCRLRVVNRKNDRSIDSKGYMDLNEIMDAYPQAIVRRK